jgi:hypothetical protein
MKPFIEIIGWIGAVLVLLAYGLLSAHKLNSRSVTYQVLNIGGSIGLVINTGWNGAIPSAAVNIIWMGIGAHALIIDEFQLDAYFGVGWSSKAKFDKGAALAIRQAF